MTADEIRSFVLRLDDVIAAFEETIGEVRKTDRRRQLSEDLDALERVRDDLRQRYVDAVAKEVA